MYYVSKEEDTIILAKLRARTDSELRHLRNSARKFDTPRAFGIRFLVLKVLFERVFPNMEFENLKTQD
jgi:hypothetical protein